MTLNFTAEVVEEIEHEKGNVAISLIVGDFSFTNLVFLVSKGLGQGKEKAREKIMEEFKNGKDAIELQTEIIKQLEDEHFLSQKLKMSEEIERNVAKAAEFLKAGLVNNGGKVK